MSVQTYRIGPQNQIIDLNGSSVNFDINFAVKSKSGKPFEAVVVDQDQLDSGKELEYKNAENGEISANLIADKNNYKSYNLVLRSAEAQDVDVIIDKKIIPANLPPLPVKEAVVPKPSRKSWLNWKTIALVVVIVVGIGLLLYFYFKGNGDSESSKSSVSESKPALQVETEVSSPLSTYSNQSSLSKALDDISPSP